MRSLIAAELLRLRTVRSPRWIALGGLALVALITLSNVRSDATWPAASLGDALRALALTAALIPAVFAASTVGSAFQRGEVPMTYLLHPGRATSLAAQTLVLAALGLLYTGLAAGVVAALGLSTATGADVPAEDVARLVAGAAAGGALLSAAGVLLGAVARHATIASGGIVALSIGEGLLSSTGVHRYLPFGLLDSLMGMPGGIAPAVALALLLAYLAGFALLVSKWALPRDLM